VNGPLSSHHRYTDSNNQKDSFNLGSGGPSKNFTFVGDTDGDEAGTRTQVEVTFNPLLVEVTRASNCISSTEANKLHTTGLIKEPVFQRLSSGVTRENLRKERMAKDLGL
jgi:hypothetical protein